MTSPLQRVANHRLERRAARASIREAIRKDKAAQVGESDYKVFGEIMAASSPMTLAFGGIGAWIFSAAGILSPDFLWIGLLPVAAQVGVAVHSDKLVYAWRHRKGKLATPTTDLGELHAEVIEKEVD